MATGTLAPVARQQFFDANGDPLAGGKLYWYLAGTSTPSPAYSDAALLVPLTNPVVLDAGGWAPAMYLAALTYKAVLTDALDVTLWTQDNIASIGQLIEFLTDPRFDAIEARLTIAEGDINVIEADVAAIKSGGTISKFISNNATGTVNNWNPGLTPDCYIEWFGTAALTVTGFAAMPAGSIVRFRNAGTGIVTFPHLNVGSVAASRLFNVATSGATPVAPGGHALYISDGIQWVLQLHQQGAWITIPYSAANFTATVGTWTVVAGNQGIKYWLNGKTLLIFISVQASSVSVFTANLLLAGFPFVFGGDTFQPLRVADNGAVGLGMGQPSAGLSRLAFWTNFGGAGFSAAVNTTGVEGRMTSEVV